MAASVVRAASYDVSPKLLKSRRDAYHPTAKPWAETAEEAMVSTWNKFRLTNMTQGTIKVLSSCSGESTGSTAIAKIVVVP